MGSARSVLLCGVGRRWVSSSYARESLASVVTGGWEDARAVAVRVGGRQGDVSRFCAVPGRLG
jgi:hypothetical protein